MADTHDDFDQFTGEVLCPLCNALVGYEDVITTDEGGSQCPECSGLVEPEEWIDA